MGKIDPNASPGMDPLQRGDDVQKKTRVKHHKGIAKDPGGKEADKKKATGDKGPILQDPSGDLTPQSYTDAADAFSDISITQALIAVAQAANEDRESSNKEQLDEINASYQDSMNAVAKLNAAADDTYTARIIKDSFDIGQNALNFTGSAIVTKTGGTNQGKIMGANQAVGAGAGAVGDVGDMIAAGDAHKATIEQNDAQKDQSAATKDSAYAQKDGDHASFNGQMLSLAIQIFQQKAESELQTERNLSNYS